VSEMTEQEKFDRHFYVYLSDDYSKRFAWKTWQAAKQDSAAEIALINNEIKELSDNIYKMGKAYAKVYMDKQQLQADNQKLRDVLESVYKDLESARASRDTMQVIRQALASTLAQTLTEYDNEVIER
jgi:chromosome segregation ATPase